MKEQATRYVRIKVADLLVTGVLLLALFVVLGVTGV